MKIGITCSSFDLLHAGHIKMLEQAKSHCDYLICALQTDPTIDRPEKNKPVQSMIERYIQLDAVKYVDQIVPYATENDLKNIFSSFKLDCRIIGEEYKNQDFTGKSECLQRGVEIIYNTREYSWSSSELRQRIEAKYGHKWLDQLGGSKTKENTLLNESFYY